MKPSSIGDSAATLAAVVASSSAAIPIACKVARIAASLATTVSPVSAI
jgi:hypothetical protein